MSHSDSHKTHKTFTTCFRMFKKLCIYEISVYMK